MKNLLKKRLTNEKGLTLVELLAVIVILGIIAAIAVPSIGNVIEKSRLNAIKSDALMILSAADLYLLENPDGTDLTAAKLVEAGFLDSTGTMTGTTSIIITPLKDSSQTTKTITGDGENGKSKIKFAKATKDGINSAKDIKSGDTISK